MDRAQKLFLAGTSVMVLAALGVGLYLNGNPSELRLMRLDEQRVQNLRSLATAINAYEERRDTLPPALDAMSTTIEQWNYLRLTDPETGADYEYRIVDAEHYELCAVFHRATPADTQELFLPPFWNHDAGRHCFTIDPGGTDILG